MANRTRLSEAEAAPLLGVSVRTLKRWRRAGTIAHQRTPGGRITYTADDLAQFQARCHRVAQHVPS